MLPILQVGGVAIQIPGLLSLAGVWFGLSAIERQTARMHLPGSTIQNMVLLGLVAGIVGARLGYAARYLDVYIQDPLGLIALQPATLSLQAGLFVGLIACWIYGRGKELPLWPTMDALAPGLAVFALFTGISHLASGNAFGAPASVPWAIQLWGALRHPSQVYEIIAGVRVLLAVLRSGRNAPFPGFGIGLWVALASASRLLLEAFRGDSALFAGGVRAAQVIALSVLVLALIGLHWLARTAVILAGDAGSPQCSDEG
jgi:phosphatidylglycerol:prolipoprotein diacylglycerol transferase